MDINVDAFKLFVGINYWQPLFLFKIFFQSSNVFLVNRWCYIVFIEKKKKSIPSIYSKVYAGFDGNGF